MQDDIMLDAMKNIAISKDKVDINSKLLPKGEMNKLGNRNCIKTKVTRYWEEEFESGNFTQEQIRQMSMIPVNEYLFLNSQEMGYSGPNIIFEIPKRRNLRNKFLNRCDMSSAVSVYYDPFAIEEYDAEHSTIDEDRYKMIGVSKDGEHLDVVYFERIENTIRVISVCKASSMEVKEYESNKYSGRP